MKKLASILLLLLLIRLAADAQTILPKHDFGNNHEPVRTVLFTPDGRHLVAGGYLTIYDVENGSRFFETKPYNQTEVNLIKHARISNNGRYLATVKTNRVEVINLATQTLETAVRAGRITAADINPENNTLVYSRLNGDIIFHDIERGKKISSHNLGRFKPVMLAWSSKGQYLAIGCRGNVFILFDTEKKTPIYNTRLSGNGVTDLEFSDDGQYLGLTLLSGEAVVIDTEKEEPLRSWPAHAGKALAVAFHPSGKYIATGGDDKMINIWNVQSGEKVDGWSAHQREILSLDFSPDGTMLASGCDNSIISRVNDTRVWDLSASGIPVSLAQAQDKVQDKGVPAYNNEVVKEDVGPVSNDLEASVAAEQKRLALVIGNGIYTYGGTLANPENDANDIGTKLQDLGFDVMLFNNLDLVSFKKSIDDFGLRLADYDVGLFYYAGHGIQVRGENYLIPVDANLRTENDVEYDCVNAGRLLSKMEDAGSTTNIVILDACRDNPFERSWRRATHGMGLAFMTAPAGSLISYATSPGATASDGSGRNGLFTTALLDYIDEPGITILEMFQKVRTFVREESEGEQVPWESTSLEGNFYMKY